MRGGFSRGSRPNGAYRLVTATGSNSAAVAATEAADISASAAGQVVEATVSAIETDDVAVGSAGSITAATVAATQSPDIMAASAGAINTADTAAIETDDIAAGAAGPENTVIIDTHDYGPDDRRRAKRWKKEQAERASLREQLEALLRPAPVAPVVTDAETPIAPQKPLPASLTAETLAKVALPTDARLPVFRDIAAERARDEEEIEMLLLEAW